nr:hypothetical protein [Tanacetum cinerariifolium]
MQVTLHYEAIVIQVTLHDKRIVMQVTLHYEVIVMQVTLHDKRIVMQVKLHYEEIVIQVTLHDKRIVMQVTLHYEASELAIPNFTPADWRSTLLPIECLEWCSLDACMIAVIVGKFDLRQSPSDTAEPASQ